MATTQILRTEVPAIRRLVDVEIVVPVYNEEKALAGSLERLHRYLEERFPLSWLITVADNASTDRTWSIACRLAAELPNVQALRLEGKGRGLALRAAWLQSSADVVAYMDVDLSTDLRGLLPLVAPLLSGHSDVAIGSRLAPGSRVVRGTKRELISRSYNLILRTAFGNVFSDAQCGFKALRSEVARALVPLVEDDGWFFDTELLVLAERNGLRIHEVPVDWVDDTDSRVAIVETARQDLWGVVRVLRSFARGGGRLEQARDHAGGAFGRDRGRPSRRRLFLSALPLLASLGALAALGALVSSNTGLAVVAALLVGAVGAALCFAFSARRPFGWRRRP